MSFFILNYHLVETIISPYQMKSRKFLNTVDVPFKLKTWSFSVLQDFSFDLKWISCDSYNMQLWYVKVYNFVTRLFEEIVFLAQNVRILLQKVYYFNLHHKITWVKNQKYPLFGFGATFYWIQIASLYVSSQPHM